jgi:hypothetical protein
MSEIPFLIGSKIEPSGIVGLLAPQKGSKRSGSEFADLSTAATYVDLPSPKQLPPRSRWDRSPDASRVQTTAIDGDTLSGRLFDARGRAKLAAAQFAMHLEPAWREKVFRQIDDLMDASEWESADGLLSDSSVRTFLRFVVFADVESVPSLGMTNSGNLVAAWRRDTRRLTLEFQAGDFCRAVISHVVGDDPSIVTFSGHVRQARDFLARETFPLG